MPRIIELLQGRRFQVTGDGDGAGRPGRRRPELGGELDGENRPSVPDSCLRAETAPARGACRIAVQPLFGGHR